MALVGVATGCFLTFVLIVEDFLHQHEQHSDGFVFIELICDFVLCTHVAITSLYYGPAYFTDSWRLSEPVVAFLCITSLYVYEATSRAEEGRVPHETVFALDMFRDIVRVARLVLFSQILMRTMKKYRAMTDLGPGDDAALVGSTGPPIDTSEIGVQMHAVSLPSIQVTTRRVSNAAGSGRGTDPKYEEIPGSTTAESTIVGGKALPRRPREKVTAPSNSTGSETKAHVADGRTADSSSESDGDESD